MRATCILAASVTPLLYPRITLTPYPHPISQNFPYPLIPTPGAAGPGTRDQAAPGPGPRGMGGWGCFSGVSRQTGMFPGRLGCFPAAVLHWSSRRVFYKLFFLPVLLHHSDSTESARLKNTTDKKYHRDLLPPRHM